MKLEELREKINFIDLRMIHLLSRRRALVLEVGRLKGLMGLKVYDRSREGRLVNFLNENAPSSLPEKWIREFAGVLFRLSKEDQFQLAAMILKKESNRSSQKPLNRKKVLVVGVGLMGGSLLKALHFFSKDFDLWGLDSRFPTRAPKWLKRAKRQDLENCEILILAMPVGEIANFLKQNGSRIASKCLVLDIGSTKEKILKVAKKHLRSGVDFVGAHPLCGKETTGFEFSDYSLYVGCTTILCPSPSCSQEGLQQAHGIFKDIGAKTYVMDPREHDEMLAMTSHLPFIISVALANCSRPKFNRELPPSDLAPNSPFQSLTRTASADFNMWSSILRQNDVAIEKALRAFIRELEHMKTNLQKQRIKKRFDVASQFRQSLLGAPTQKKERFK